MMKTKETKKQLEENLRQLQLSTMRHTYESQEKTAQTENWQYWQYLYYMSEEECHNRRQRRIERYLKESCLPLEKTFAVFEMNRMPRKVTQQVQALRDGEFISRRENILAFGNPGSGKTHLLCALGHDLIQNEHRVYYAMCAKLVQQLLYAKRELKLPQYLKKLSKFDVIIIDDIGYVHQGKEEVEVLFTLLADRYERGSVMLTSNLPFSKWDQIFGDPMTTAAAIDRLVHHSTILEINVSSYRMQQAKKQTKQK